MTENNVIYCGDCLEVMKKIPDESIDLIYLDPPFFSQKEYENFWIKDQVTSLRFSDKDWETLRSSINPNLLKEYEAIEKRWKGGHRGIYVYIAYMRERLEQCWRLLKKDGAIYLHCDWHAGHYLKMMMDEVFGYDNFRNEIAVRRIRKNVRERKEVKKLNVGYETIFFYAKSDNHFIKLPTRKEVKAERWHDFEASGYRTGMDYDLFGRKPKRGNHWRWTKERAEKSIKDGILRANPNTGKPQYLVPASTEVTLDTLWGDLISSSFKHGYPTEKNEVLLARIIEMSTNKGDLILDPFCGCGTAIASAQKLNRNFIGIDISRIACDVMKHRLENGIKVIGGETEVELRKMDPHDFARLVIVEMLNGTINPKKSGDMGIDGWIEFMTIPVQVKRWGHKVGRPEIDKFKTAIDRGKKTAGMVVAFEFSRDCYNEVERIKKEDKIEIKLKTVKEIFN
ncbi:restriction endonuclease [Candidatus Woesearchaeota archaeon]|nr:restriction endonuclease [Candidatus Woesearchaeota archaeon]HIH25766.1 hypothetical protein [Nanoarchaeota archaeon]